MTIIVRPEFLGGSVSTGQVKAHVGVTFVQLTLAAETASCVQWLTPAEARQVAAALTAEADKIDPPTPPGPRSYGITSAEIIPGPPVEDDGQADYWQRGGL